MTLLLVPLQDPDGDPDANTIVRVDIGTVRDPRNSSAAGYVYTTNNYARALTVTDGNTIAWDDVRMRKDQVFRTIVRLATTGTATADGSIADPPDGNTVSRDSTSPDGVYPFYTQLATAGGPMVLSLRTLAMRVSTLSEIEMLLLHLWLGMPSPQDAETPTIDADGICGSC